MPRRHRRETLNLHNREKKITGSADIQRTKNTAALKNLERTMEKTSRVLKMTSQQFLVKKSRKPKKWKMRSSTGWMT